MTAKNVGFKTLLGKEVYVKHRYERDPEGPYILEGIDSDFIRLRKPERERGVWFSSALIEYISEGKPHEEQ